MKKIKLKENIQFLIQDKKITVKEIAKNAYGEEDKWPVDAVYECINGKFERKLNILAAISNLTGIYIDDLLFKDVSSGYEIKRNEDIDIYSIGQKMREYMIKKNIAYAELSLLTNIPIESLKSYRKGRRIPPINRLATIADALGVTVDMLL